MTIHYLGLLSGVTSDTSLGSDRFSTLFEENVRSYDERAISIDPLAEVIDECKRRFTDAETGDVNRTASDRWLAPRLHAALRLTKREATYSEIWTYLAVYAFPDYVAWRWGRDRQAALSFTRDVKKHPFKRLWWGAEMFRNGADYSAVEAALSRSDIANTSLSTRVMNNRAVALGVLRFLAENELGSRQVNPLSTQLRTSAVTVALDSACPNYSESMELDEEWLQAEPRSDEIIARPVGPQHGGVLEDEIRRAEAVLKRVIDLSVVKRYRKSEDAA